MIHPRSHRRLTVEEKVWQLLADELFRYFRIRPLLNFAIEISGVFYGSKHAWESGGEVSRVHGRTRIFLGIVD